MFKPNISTMVGKLYAVGDQRRDSGFTIFYMGINAGAFIAPLLTGWLAQTRCSAPTEMPAYKFVFIAAGIGMLISLVWFWIGRAQLQGIGRPPAGGGGQAARRLRGDRRAGRDPVVYSLLRSAAARLQVVLTVMFIGLARDAADRGHPRRHGGPRQGDRDADHLRVQHPVLDVLRAGRQLVHLPRRPDRRPRLSAAGSFPTAWFQSVNSIAIIVLAPVVAWIWVAMARKNVNPSIPRKFGLGLMFNGLAFLLLMFALSSLIDMNNKIPFWTLFAVYWIQSVGELCLSPIGLSMVTKLAPLRLVGLGMGGWFLSTGIGNNLSGIFASDVSGEGGMTTASALSGYTFGFWALLGAGVLLFLIAPLVQKLMHGVK